MGEPIWRCQYDQAGHGIMVDSEGNTIIMGEFQRIVNFGTSNLINSDKPNAFVAKFRNDGNPIWSTQFSRIGYQQGRAIAVDKLGKGFVTGDYHDEMNVTGIHLPLPSQSSSGSRDL